METSAKISAIADLRGSRVTAENICESMTTACIEVYRANNVYYIMLM